jgi:hypothetical protein
MHRRHQKGTNVIHPERSPRTPRTITGVIAMLRAVPRFNGRGAPSLVLIATVLSTFAVLAAVPVSASASKRCPVNFLDTSAVKRTLTSVVLGGDIKGLGEPSCEAGWTIEWAEAPTGSWKLFPGGSGTVTGVGGEITTFQTGELTGLEPETTYYERGTVKDLASPEGGKESGTFSTKPLGPIEVSSPSASSIGETSVHLRGSVAPSPFETRWRLEWSASKSAVEKGEGAVAAEGTISQAEAEARQTATSAEPVYPEVDLTGLTGNHVYYSRIVAEDKPEWKGVLYHKEVASAINQFETFGPPTGEAFATYALRGETVRVLGYVVPHGFDAHYRFQYGPTVSYGSETPPEDVGSGGPSGIEASTAAADLPGLQAGGTYHYRIAISGGAGGATMVFGPDHTLTVPVGGEGGEAGEAGEAAGGCPNEALRTGLSAGLPACRAYEQVTPVDKEGAQEAFSQSNQITGVGGLVGEDGNHVVFEHLLVHWGSGQAPYFFTRDPSRGWQMASGQAQPEAGVNTYHPQLFSPNLTSFAFAAGWVEQGVESPDLEYKAGVPGGPYPTVAAVPRPQTQLVDENGSAPLGWVAASDDFSKLILASTDRTLAGHPTGTASGADLYEYSGGGLRQLNVGVGSCGATIVFGTAETYGRASGDANAMPSSRHAVSVDGSRVFFEAVPGSNCTEPEHLYMRVNGVETSDLGAYRFRAADAHAGEVLVEAQSPETKQVLLYDTATKSATPLLTVHSPPSESLPLLISEDFSTIYFSSQEKLTAEAPSPTGGKEHSENTVDVYRYDLATKALRFIVQLEAPLKEFHVTPDGRYVSWDGSIAGLPQRAFTGTNQLMYDARHNSVECVSCASSFNPEPKFDVAFPYATDGGVPETRNGAPQVSVMSVDGSRVFFDTIAALLPGDIDGELSPATLQWWSPSSDVYEWRRNGVEGCAHVQGCLSLISSGHGGSLVQLLGADPSGRNVFFTTTESLVAGDTDKAIDIYDARVGGGFPGPPPPPVECQGGACHSPLAGPIDTTPASLSFSGPGNPPPPAAAVTKKVKVKVRPCGKRSVRKRGRCVKRRGRKAARRPVKHGRGGHR